MLLNQYYFYFRAMLTLKIFIKPAKKRQPVKAAVFIKTD